MPHFQFDFRADLETFIGIGELCKVIRAKAATIETFPMAGNHVHALRVEHIAKADGDVKNWFIDLCVRLR